MIVLRRGLIIVVLGLLVLITGSCASIKQAELQNKKTSQQQVTQLNPTQPLQYTGATVLNENKKRDIAKKLYTDFNSYADKFDEDTNNPSNKSSIRGSNIPALYSAVMASNRAIGILDGYKTYFNSEELEKVLKRYKDIQYKMGSFSTVYHGYSKSGLHFIVIRPTSMTSDFAFSDAMNKVRSDDKELSFLFDMTMLNTKLGIFDVFVEDLISQRKEIDIDISVAYEDGQNKVDLKRIEKPDDISIDQVLAKYQRQYTNKPKFINGEWKLVFFDKLEGHPIITITDNGEKIVLKK